MVRAKSDGKENGEQNGSDSMFRMRFPLCIVFALFAWHSVFWAQSGNEELRKLYDAHRWFELRDLVSKRTADLFFRAAAETAFHQDRRAQADLSRFLASHPTAEMEVEARELILGMAFREGRYQSALNQAQQIRSMKPDAQDIANFIPTLKVLAPFVRQTVVSRQPCKMRIDRFDQNLVLPVSIGGVAANYILDNGFSLSGMSESEAKRLRLTVNTVTAQIDTMSGAPVTVRLAVVPNLVLGRLNLRNVAFYVLPDEQPPFNQLPIGRRGILGLQVVLALRHFAWQPKSGTFNILPETATQPSREANLAFDGSSIFARLSFRGSPVDMSLDTGAVDTVLYPSFARQFSEIDKDGAVEQHRVTGVGGSTSIKSLTVPSLDFQLGGSRTLTLKPATILLDENNSTSAWFRGNLGMNLLNQANSVEANFDSMRLTLK